jgi:hypothetical protein
LPRDTFKGLVSSVTWSLALHITVRITDQSKKCSRPT